MPQNTLKIATFLLGSAMAVQIAPAGTLWYNGNFDGRDALANEENTTVTQSNVYDDFIVPAGQTWKISAVFSNDLMDFTAADAEWEIRSGVSLNNGGTLIASGTGPATQTATGRSGFGYNEYDVEVSGLSIVLDPGTYWLTVAPTDSGGGRSFLSTTSGAGCTGLPCGNDANSYWDSAFFSENFGSPSDNLGPGRWDFSMGVNGSTSGIPEPGSLGLIALGAVGMLMAGKRCGKRVGRDEAEGDRRT